MELQNLIDTRAQIQEAYGSKTIRTANMLERFTVISTGIFIIDLALMGGIAESTGNQFFGWESSSKTTNCYRVVGEFQKKYPNKVAAWVDLDPMGIQHEWAMACGVDLARLVVVQPENGEQAVDCCDVLARTREVGLIVVDGISGFVSAKLLDEAASDVQISYIAKNAGKFCSKMRVAMVERSKTPDKLTVMSTNQWRYKMTMFGDPRVLPGGTQCNFFHQVKLELTAKPFNTAKKADKAPSTTDAFEGTFTAAKTKCVSGIRQGSYTIITDPEHALGYGHVDDAETVVTYAMITGVIEGKAPKLNVPVFGATFQKKDDVIARLRNDPAFNLFVRQATLSLWRAKKGLPLFPHDNYLAGSFQSRTAQPSGIVRPPSSPAGGPPNITSAAAAPVRPPVRIPITRAAS